MTELWKRIEEIFEQALDLPAADRARFLAERCGADDALRHRVESLLASDSVARPDFLERPAAGPRTSFRADAPDPLIGRTIGGYTIKLPIARGGMGTVYLAEQTQPRRDVALKVLNTSLWSQSAERRFGFESQILARLQHPNIAQVYEAGSARLGDEQGRMVHFFAMEFVPNAMPISMYCEAHQLDNRDRLALFIHVCDAVAFAHQRGIIHRDLKPANILVSGETADTLPAETSDCQGSSAKTAGAAVRVKVIDFGVARVADTDVAVTTMHTDTGQLIGTLQYMSPEQCDADPLGLDIRSDVYSLGVVLYELLCGRLPYEVSKTNIFAATHTIKQTPPTPPQCGPLPMPREGRRGGGHIRSRRQAVKGDLEAILLKALEKDRVNRYANVSDLAADIRRHMIGEPISARPPTKWTQALRWMTRHPKLASTITAGFIALSIIVGTAVSLWIVNSRPYELVLTRAGIQRESDGSALSAGDVCLLRSLSGRVLKDWRTRGQRGIRFHALVDRPRQFGGGTIVILGFGDESGSSEGYVCAFNATGPYDTPIWEGRIKPDQLPKLTDENASRRRFRIEQGWAFDVFRENPGAEVVLVFKNGFSQRALRIYSLDGSLLYQIWQDGGLASAVWLEAPQLLVIAGGDETIKSRIKDATYAPILFALHPSLGFSTREYLHLESGDSPLHPVWVRHFHPPSSEGLRWEAQLTTDVGEADPARNVGIAINVTASDNASEGCTYFIVDEHGNEVRNSRFQSDLYKKHPERFPPEEIFKLSDAPPTNVWHPTSQPTSGRTTAHDTCDLHFPGGTVPIRRPQNFVGFLFRQFREIDLRVIAFPSKKCPEPRPRKSTTAFM